MLPTPVFTHCNFATKTLKETNYLKMNWTLTYGKTIMIYGKTFKMLVISFKQLISF